MVLFQLSCIIAEQESGVAILKDYEAKPEDDQFPVKGDSAPEPVKTTVLPQPPLPQPLPPKMTTPPPAPTTKPAAPVAGPPTSGVSIAATPYARSLAKEKGINLVVSHILSHVCNNQI